MSIAKAGITLVILSLLLCTPIFCADNDSSKPSAELLCQRLYGFDGSKCKSTCESKAQTCVEKCTENSEFKCKALGFGSDKQKCVEEYISSCSSKCELDSMSCDAVCDSDYSACLNHDPNSVSNLSCPTSCSSGQIQLDFPDCGCVQETISELRGRIYFSDTNSSPLINPLLFDRQVTKRPLRSIHYEVHVDSQIYEGYTDADGGYEIKFFEPLTAENNTLIKLRILFEDEQRDFYVGNAGSRHAPPDNKYWSSIPLTLDKIYGLNKTNLHMLEDLAFDISDENQTYKKAAKLYYNIKNGIRLGHELIGADLKKSPSPMPVTIIPEGDRAYFSSPYGIAIGEGAAAFDRFDSPLNVEWHELCHRFQYDESPRFPKTSLDSDSMTQRKDPTGADLFDALAVVCAMKMMQYSDTSYPPLYPVDESYVNLEINHRFNQDDSNSISPSLVIASILWDITDGEDVADNDAVHIPFRQLWEFMMKADHRFTEDSGGMITDVDKLYLALSQNKDWGINYDPDVDGHSDIDEIFLNHGYDLGQKQVVDDHTDQDMLEELGKIDLQQEKYIGVNSRSDYGSLVESYLTLSYIFPPKYSNYDYKYSIKIPDSGKRIYILPPVVDIPYTLVLRSDAVGYSQSANVATYPSDLLLEKFESVSAGPVLEHTFVLDYEGNSLCKKDSDCELNHKCVRGVCEPLKTPTTCSSTLIPVFLLFFMVLSLLIRDNLQARAVGEYI